MNRLIICVMTALSLCGCGDVSQTKPQSPQKTSQVGWIDNSSFSVRTLVKKPNVGMKSGQAQDEASSILDLLRNECDLPENNDSNTGPTLYCSAGALGNDVVIYGITNHARQDQIVKALHDLGVNQHWKPVYLEFRNQERFASKGNARRRQGEVVVYSTLVDWTSNKALQATSL